MFHRQSHPNLCQPNVFLWQFTAGKIQNVEAKVSVFVLVEGKVRLVAFVRQGESETSQVHNFWSLGVSKADFKGRMRDSPSEGIKSVNISAMLHSYPCESSDIGSLTFMKPQKHAFHFL